MEIQIKPKKLEIDLGAEKVYPELENLEIIPRVFEQKFNHPDSYGYDEITVKAMEVNLQNKEVNPSTAEQIVIADEEYDGLNQVNIKAVDNTIDENIKPENIKEGVNILGIEGKSIPQDFLMNYINGTLSGDVVFPEGIKRLNCSSNIGNTNIETITLPEGLEELFFGFRNTYSELLNIPESIKYLFICANGAVNTPAYAWDYVTFNGTEINLPNLINGFSYYHALKAPNCEIIRIGKDCTNIIDLRNIFLPKLKKIYIDRAEGAISGAPWNATDAEIIWTGDS